MKNETLLLKKWKIFKMVIETKLYVTKIFDNDLFAIRRCKISLILNKLAYLRMGTLDLSEV